MTLKLKFSLRRRVGAGIIGGEEIRILRSLIRARANFRVRGKFYLADFVKPENSNKIIPGINNTTVMACARELFLCLT